MHTRARSEPKGAIKRMTESIKTVCRFCMYRFIADIIPFERCIKNLQPTGGSCFEFCDGRVRKHHRKPPTSAVPAPTSSKYLELRKLQPELQTKLLPPPPPPKKSVELARKQQLRTRQAERAHLRSKSIREQEIGCDILCAFLTGKRSEQRSYYRLRKQEKAMKRKHGG